MANLVQQHGPESRRPAAKMQHPFRYPARLDAHGDRDRLRKGGPHALVAPWAVAKGPELVAGDEHLRRLDALAAEQTVAHPGDCIALVRQPDLNVLGVSGDARVREAVAAGCLPRQGHDLR
ncbi:MAG: hypothetical protein C4290_00285 [Chloroflexota bacterium]